MRGVIFEAIGMFLFGGIVVFFFFFVRSTWRHVERNETLTRENEELRRRIEELEKK